MIRTVYDYQGIYGAIEAEREEICRQQADKTMPLIGPLLDAWDGIPNDVRYDEELAQVARILAAIESAMLGEDDTGEQT